MTQRENNSNLLLQFSQHLVCVLCASQTVHNLQLGQFNVDGIVIFAEKDSNVILEDSWSPLDDQKDISERDVLDLWPRRQQAN